MKRKFITEWGINRIYNARENYKCLLRWLNLCLNDVVLLERTISAGREFQIGIIRLKKIDLSCPWVGWTVGSGRVTIFPDYGGSGRVSTSDYKWPVDNSVSMRYRRARVTLPTTEMHQETQFIFDSSFDREQRSSFNVPDTYTLSNGPRLAAT